MIKIIYLSEEYVHNPLLGHGEHVFTEEEVFVPEAQLIAMISQCVWDGDAWWYADSDYGFRVM